MKNIAYFCNPSTGGVLGYVTEVLMKLDAVIAER